MKFACFHAGGTVGIGAVDEGGNLIRRLDPEPRDMIELIERWDGFKGGTGGDPIPVREVQLLAPIPRPRRSGG